MSVPSAPEYTQHDPYGELFRHEAPGFSVFERHFLILSWLTGELGDADLVGDIEACGEAIDAAAESTGDLPENAAELVFAGDAERAVLPPPLAQGFARLAGLSERLLTLLDVRTELPRLPEFPVHTAALRLSWMRLRALIAVAYFQEDPEGSRQTLALAAQILDGLPHSFEPTLEAADVDLSNREELFLEGVLEGE